VLKEKLNGPIGVKKSSPIPVELLILLDSSIESLKSTPQTFAKSMKYLKSRFSTVGKSVGIFVERLMAET